MGVDHSGYEFLDEFLKHPVDDGLSISGTEDEEEYEYYYEDEEEGAR